MKKNYTFILILVAIINLNAQITLTSATSSPQIGDSYNYILTTNYLFDVSQSGANQTWDFSSATGSMDTSNVIDLSNSLEPLTYPQANLVSSSTNGESYLSSSTSGLSIEGLYSPSVARIIYTDKQEYLKYPITYNDVFNGTFSGTVENIAAAQNFNRSGTTVITADGYGSLILPYTTVNNVLRVKITNTFIDTFMGIPTGTTNDIIIVWFNATNKSYIASTSDVYFNGELVGSYAYHLTESDLVLNVEDTDITSNLSIYPNPAKDYIVINNSQKDSISINLHNMNGALIKTLDVNNGKTLINTSDLHSGIYVLNYIKESKYYTKKLVIE